MFESVEKPRQSSWFWPAVDNLDGARAASRQGMLACLTFALATGILAAFGVYGFSPWVNAWVFADIALYLAAALGIRRASRVAAVGALLLFLIELAVLFAQTGGTGGYLAIVVSVAFVNGVRGTFAVHSLSKNAAVGRQRASASSGTMGPPNNELQRTRPAQRMEPRR